MYAKRITGVALILLSVLLFGCSSDGRHHWWHHDDDRKEVTIGDKGHGKDSEDMSITVKAPQN